MTNHALQADKALPHTRTSLLISLGFRKVSAAIGWLWLALMAVIVLNVTLRYLFGEGRVEFEEIQWHLYATGFLLGLATCMDTDDHVRVDILHGALSLRAQAWIELYGLILLFFPFVLMILIYSFDFVQFSFSTSEVSNAPGGLPLRWLIKSVLPLAMLALLIAGWARLLRVSCCLFATPRPVSRANHLEHGPDASE